MNEFSSFLLQSLTKYWIHPRNGMTEMQRYGRNSNFCDSCLNSHPMKRISPFAAVLSINSKLCPKVLWGIYDALLYETQCIWHGSYRSSRNWYTKYSSSYMTWICCWLHRSCHQRYLVTLQSGEPGNLAVTASTVQNVSLSGPTYPSDNASKRSSLTHMAHQVMCYK